MRLIIDIPEDMLEKVKDGYVPLGINKYLKNGTPLPKGHGRLIDADVLFNEFCEIAVEPYVNAQTIIPADKEGEE